MFLLSFRFLDRYLVRDVRQPWQTSRLIAASLTIINMLYNCETLPDKLEMILPKYLKSLTVELKKALQEMCTNSEYQSQSSPPNPKADARGIETVKLNDELYIVSLLVV